MSRKRLKVACLISAVLVLSLVTGCTVQPKLKFSQLKEGFSVADVADKYTFNMPTTVITVSVKEPEKDSGETWKPVFSAANVPGDKLYAIGSADSWFVDTKYTLGYQQNSTMLKSFGVELTDNRVKYMQEVGGIAVSLIPLILALDGQVQDDGLAVLKKNLPMNIDVAKCFVDALDKKYEGEKVSCNHEIKDKNGKSINWTAQLVTDKNNINSTSSYESFFNNETRKDFPVPECKTAYVALTYKGTQSFISPPITIANPTRVTVIPTPAKGSITYHPICSADTLYSPPDVAKPLDLIKATIDQVAAAKKAFDDAKSNKTKTN